MAFRSLSEAIDTDSASGRLLFHMLGALAEFERSLISERPEPAWPRPGPEEVQMGRPAKLSAAQVSSAREAVQQGHRRLSDVAAHLYVSPSTLKALARQPCSPECRTEQYDG